MGDWEGSVGRVVLDPSPIKISRPYYGPDFTLFEWRGFNISMVS